MIRHQCAADMQTGICRRFGIWTDYDDFKSEDEIPEGRIRNEVWVDFTRMVTSAMGTEYKEPEKHWSDKNIAAAQDMGIVNEFVIPDDPIPREVMMKYVVNALGVNGN